MDDDVDLVGGHVEQPVRLDDLEALVHQRGRIDGDLAAHLPRRMTQRLLGRHPLERRGGEVAKRSARRGENQPPDLARAAVRADTDAWRCARCRPEESPRRAARGLRHQRAGHDQHFLVGERDRLAGVDRGEHGFEAGGPGRRADDDVDVGMRGNGDQAFGATVIDDARHPAPHAARSRSTASLVATPRRRADTAAPARRGRAALSPAASATTESRSGCASHNRQRTAPDRAGRAENGQIASRDVSKNR